MDQTSFMLGKCEDHPVTVLTAGLRSLRDHKIFCDFVVECDDDYYDVHRCILCAHSLYFDRMCGGQFTEMGDNRIKLQEDDPSCVKRMLDYFYDLDYTIDEVGVDDICALSPAEQESTAADQHTPAPVGDKDAMLHARMYAIGEKYIVLGLKALARQRFIETASSLSRIELAPVVREVYTSTPDQDRGLRDVVLGITTKCVADLTHDERFCSSVSDVPHFGFELLMSTVKKVEEQNACSYQIGDCAHCPARESNPPLYCRHNRQAQQTRIL